MLTRQVLATPQKILLLSTSGFAVKLRESKLDMKIPELPYIVCALGLVAVQWTELNDYIAGLLSEDFMVPESYVKLLFDDATFSRSRLYFWIIGCLNEFDVSIADNIKQWDLFREASWTAFPPGQNSGDNSQETDPGHLSNRQPDLFKEADDLRETLENLRSQFRNQLETVKALRDGVSS